MNIKLRHRGFSLIEVMVALLILAVGILGISKLQGNLMRSGSDANQRTTAISLAQRKIDDLKSFVHLTVGTTTDTIPDTWTTSGPSSTVSAAVMSFDHIDTDQGGAPVGSTGLLAGNVTVGNYAYTLGWDVTDYFYPSASAAASTAVPTTISSRFKQVTVNVAWTGEWGEPESISINTIIDSYAPALTALADNSSTGGTPPQASYTPELAPDVIDIKVNTTVGDNKFRQTSKPLPDAVSTGADSNTIVSFEVVTYHEDPANSGEFLADINEEFITVDCKCQFSSVDASALPPAHVVWDATEEDRYDHVGDYISKQTATQTGNANDVDEICITCCADHHDDDASDVKYVEGTSSGNHVHYQADGTTVAVQADGDEYVESCRFKRIDGILRVFQDWDLYTVTSVSRADLADGQAVQTEYSTYVANFVDNVVAGPVTATKPDASTDVTTTVGAAHQLENRGIYIDQVYDLSGSVDPTGYTSYVGDSGNLDRLEKVPFSEVNLSLLAHWTTADNTKITVTDEAVATIADPASNYYGTYTRGYINALAVTGETIVTATISDSNNGITQIVNDTNVGTSDGLDIQVTAGGGAITVTGSYAITYPLGTTGASTSISPSSNCSLPGTPGNTYTCSFTSPWTGTIQISSEKTTGAPGLRCTGQSVAFSGSALAINSTHSFASFACN